MGQQAADWIEVRSIPTAIDLLPYALTAQNLEAYKADMAEPGKVYHDPKRLERYIRMYGNACSAEKGEHPTSTHAAS